MEPQQSAPVPNSAGGSKLPLVIVIVLALLLVVGAGWWAKSRFLGKTTTYTDDEGNRYTATEVGDSVTVTDKDGISLTVGSDIKLPAGFPTDIPKYPGGKILAVTHQGESTMLSMETTDSNEKARTAYRSALIANGWTVTSESADIEGLSNLAVEKDGRTGGAMISTADGKTNILWTSLSAAEANTIREQFETGGTTEE
ncbi:MAG: hypothetical protein ACOYBJ_03010 [Patescibacteria group bacterium]|jgi:hypothetical protein